MGSDVKRTEEYISENDARSLKELFKKCLRLYKEKDSSVSDDEWLEHLLKSELPELQPEECSGDVKEIIGSVHSFDENLKSVTEASKKGVSKERWLADKVQEASSNMAAFEYAQSLCAMDSLIYQKNLALEQALSVSVDGELSRVNMNPNLDGFIAENLLAESANLNASLLGKNVEVVVRDVNTANSVDLTAFNRDTGQWKHFQVKFGQDAKATIQLIERGDYANQQIIVPKEQVEEVRAYFRGKGSNKTITDHIDVWGVEGKSYSKEELKELQRQAQESGKMPQLDYSQLNTKDLAMSVGKNAAALGLFSAAVATGWTAAHKAFKGEKIEADELIEAAIKTGADSSLKIVVSGFLEIAVRKGKIPFIPQMTDSCVLAGAACIGIENAKILVKVASGEMSVTKGLDQMGRVTVSMIGGMWAAGKGAKAGAVIGGIVFGWIPVLGIPLAAASSFVGGMIGYTGGSKLGETVYNGAKKIFSAAKNTAKAAFSGIKSAVSTVRNAIGSLASRLLPV